MNKNEKSSKEKTKKGFKDLTISDNFVFTRVMQNKEIAKEVISILIGYKFDDIEFVETEKTLDVIYDSKSIRLDAYIKSEDKVINVEMQVASINDLAKRSNYYRIVIGMDALSTGDSYKDMPETYIIFICLFDPFKLNNFCYSFETYDKENKLLLDDRVRTIVYNAKKYDQAKSKKLANLLSYISDNKIENNFIKRLHKAVEKVKDNDIWKKEYMYYNAEMQDSKDTGIEIGKEQGIEIGKEQGIEYNKLENAKNLLDILDDRTIAKKIGLDIEVVQKLRKEN